MATPLTYAQQLLECLREQIHASAFDIVDEKICLRFGEQVDPGFGTNNDECCTGLAWVRVDNVTPSPIVDVDNPGCIRSSRRVTLELGTARCIPFGTVQAPPTCDQWTEATVKMDSDYVALEAALCCVFDQWEDAGAENVLMVEYVPSGPDGNCISGRMLVTFETDCGCFGGNQ